jgi:predicted AlkP superfamily pyrophosphatase or phosphodiesterase
VVLGDHSALDENKVINLNVLFHKQNLITLNGKGKIINWRAYCKSCDGSAYIYIKDKHDPRAFNEVKQLLDTLLADPGTGIENALTGEQAAKKGADGTCTFMLEAKRGYFFLDDHEGEFIRTITQEDVNRDKKYTLACHGYSPEKENYGTIFMAAGKGIKAITLPSIRLIDEAPTFARLLGVDLGQTDGRVVEEILTK